MATVRALSRFKVLILEVLEATIDPKYGEDEALKVWTVPLDTIASGPLAENVWVAPERPLREVMPLLPVPAHWPLGNKKHPEVS